MRNNVSIYSRNFTKFLAILNATPYKRFLATSSSPKSYPEVNVHSSNVTKGSRAICIFCFSFGFGSWLLQARLAYLVGRCEFSFYPPTFHICQIGSNYCPPSFPHCEYYGLSFPFAWLCLRRGFKYDFGKCLLLKHVWKVWTGSQNENMESLCLKLNYDFAAVYSYVMFFRSDILNESTCQMGDVTPYRVTIPFTACEWRLILPNVSGMYQSAI